MWEAMGVKEPGDELGPLCEGPSPYKRLRDLNGFFLLMITDGE